MELSQGILVILLVGLTIAVVCDLLTTRVPNKLTLSMALASLVLHVWFGQWGGLMFTFSGFATGLLFFLPMYLFGGMGAGDVKLLAAVGATVGPAKVFLIAVMTIVAGGVLALVYITVRGGLPTLLRRYSSMVVLLTARQPHYIPPAPGEAAGLRFPYALAIACGTALAVI